MERTPENKLKEYVKSQQFKSTLLPLESDLVAKDRTVKTSFSSL